MSKQFRQRPIVVEAVQYDGSKASIAAVLRLDSAFARFGLFADHMTVRTDGGNLRAEKGDWIIKGPAGAFSVRKADAFAATYQPAPEPAP